MRRSESQRGRPRTSVEDREPARKAGSERGKAGVSVEKRVKGGVTVTARATVEGQEPPWKRREQPWKSGP